MPVPLAHITQIAAARRNVPYDSPKDRLELLCVLDSKMTSDTVRTAMKVPPSLWVWVSVIGGGLIAASGGILATYGWDLRKRRQDAVGLSVPALLEIRIADFGSEVTITNTSPHDVENISTWWVYYLFDSKTNKMEARTTTGGNHLIASELGRGEAVRTRTDQLGIIPDSNKDREKTAVYSCVAEFFRASDRKRYIVIEPFFVNTAAGAKTLMPIYAMRESAHSGDPYCIVNILKEIETIEHVLFRASD